MKPKYTIGDKLYQLNYAKQGVLKKFIVTGIFLRKDLTLYDDSTVASASLDYDLVFEDELCDYKKAIEEIEKYFKYLYEVAIKEVEKWQN